MIATRLPGLLCVLISVVLEACGQLCLKRGADTVGPGGNAGAIVRTAANPWALAGIGAFVLEAVSWTFALRNLPLAVAFPMGSSCFVVVALFSRIFLHEKVSGRRWLGIALILAGVALIGAS